MMRVLENEKTRHSFRRTDNAPFVKSFSIILILGLAMTAADTKAVSSLATTEELDAKVAASEFVGIAIFSSIGLLLSLAVIILDQLTPGDWF